MKIYLQLENKKPVEDIPQRAFLIGGAGGNKPILLTCCYLSIYLLLLF